MPRSLYDLDTDDHVFIDRQPIDAKYGLTDSVYHGETQCAGASRIGQDALWREWRIAMIARSTR